MFKQTMISTDAPFCLIVWILGLTKCIPDHSIAIVNKTRQSINKSADGFQTYKQTQKHFREKENRNERKRGWTNEQDTVEKWIIKNKMRYCGKKENNILPFSSLFVLLISSCSLNHSVCSIYSPFSNFFMAYRSKNERRSRKKRKFPGYSLVRNPLF